VEITGSPLLGEHSSEVLSELGYTKEAIADLLNAKVI
jgi:formyl-CoA transferase